MAVQTHEALETGWNGVYDHHEELYRLDDGRVLSWDQMTEAAMGHVVTSAVIPRQPEATDDIAQPSFVHEDPNYPIEGSVLLG